MTDERLIWSYTLPTRKVSFDETYMDYCENNGCAFLRMKKDNGINNDTLFGLDSKKAFGSSRMTKEQIKEGAEVIFKAMLVVHNRAHAEAYRLGIEDVRADFRRLLGAK